MATARDIINRAFSKIGVRAAETPLTASEVEDGLDALNDMLSEWDNSGVLKGVSPVAEPDDELEIPRYADGAAKSHLALKLAPEYDRAITQGMMLDAKSSMNSMIAASARLNNTEYPSILPAGSGNTGGEYTIGAGSDFFPNDKAPTFP